MALDERWLRNVRPIQSELKLIKQELAWLQYHSLLPQPHALDEQLEAVSTFLIRNPRPNIALTMDSAKKLSNYTAELDDMALGSSFFLSSNLFGEKKTGRITEHDCDYFFHTEIGINQSITIDLGRPRSIEALTIANRRDSCQERARLLFALLHNERSTEGAKVYFIETNASFLNGTIPEISIALSGNVARFVTITSPLNTALHFSKFSIYTKRS